MSDSDPSLPLLLFLLVALLLAASSSLLLGVVLLRLVRLVWAATDLAGALACSNRSLTAEHLIPSTSDLGCEPIQIDCPLVHLDQATGGRSRKEREKAHS